MTVREILSAASGVIFIAGFLPYIRAIMKGEVKPAKSSWLIWASLDALTISGMHAKHAVNGQIIGAFVGSALIFFLALRYGTPGWTHLDKFCLGGALVGIGLWWTFNSPVLGIVVAQIVGVVGAVPTIAGAWRNPASEDRTAWTIFWVSCVLQVLAIPALTWEDAAQPASFFVGESIMMYLLYIHRPPVLFET